MVFEDYLDWYLSFVYLFVFFNGLVWVVVDEFGNWYDKMRIFSIKVVFGWDVIYGMEYVKKMCSYIEDLFEEGDGW